MVHHVQVAKTVQRRLMAIERDLLGNKPLRDCLRECVSLGGDLRSARLRDWAKQELLGYRDAEEFPRYRVVTPLIMGDGLTRRAQFTGMAIAWTTLPSFVRDEIKDTLDLASGVATLDEMARSADLNDDLVKLSLPMGADLGRMMSNENVSYERIYWGLATSVVWGVLDEIRTTAVSVLAEVRSGTPASGRPPEGVGELTDQAVIVNVYGGRRHVVNVTTNQSGSGDAGALAPEVPTVSLARSSRRLFGWIGLSAIVLAAAVALAGQLWLW
jgi:hypothetical protein